MISVFGGRGFIGSEFCKDRPDVIIHAREDYKPSSAEVLYFISTTDNYNVFTDPLLDIETNLATLIKVLQNCKAGTTFNFVSTYFVYGEAVPGKEDGACKPKGFYSITKYAAELLLISYCKTQGHNYRILRLANVVGKSDKGVSKKKNALQYLIQKLKTNEPIQLYSGGRFLRDYIHVEDVVHAMDLVLTKGALNEIYNIGNGKPVIFGDFINYARQQLNSSSEVTSIAPTEFHRTVQVDSVYMDTRKLDKLGFSPKYKGLAIVDQLL